MFHAQEEWWCYWTWRWIHSKFKCVYVFKCVWLQLNHKDHISRGKYAQNFACLSLKRALRGSTSFALPGQFKWVQKERRVTVIQPTQSGLIGLWFSPINSQIGGWCQERAVIAKGKRGVTLKSAMLSDLQILKQFSFGLLFFLLLLGYLCSPRISSSIK